MAHPVSRDIQKSAARLLQLIQFGVQLEQRLRALEMELSRPAKTAMDNLRKTLEENEIRNQEAYKKITIAEQCHIFLALRHPNFLSFWKP